MSLINDDSVHSQKKNDAANSGRAGRLVIWASSLPRKYGKQAAPGRPTTGPQLSTQQTQQCAVLTCLAEIVRPHPVPPTLKILSNDGYFDELFI